MHQPIRTIAATAAVTTAALAAAAGQALAAPAAFGALDSSGNHAVFTSAERLVAADTDSAIDVYERTGGRTILVSGGSAEEDVQLGGISADGSRIAFSTGEALTADDTDEVTDIYVRQAGAITRVSRGPGNFTGNGAHSVSFDEITPDGTVVFHTRERLDSLDDGVAYDVYGNAGAASYLISRPTTSDPNGGTDNFDATYDGFGGDGERVFFHTIEKLNDNDEDPGADDVYMHDRNGPERFISQSENSQAKAARFVGAGENGDLAVWSTSEQAVDALDNDTHVDVWSRDLTGDDVTNESSTFTAGDVEPVGVASAGAAIFIETVEPEGADDDDRVDVFSLENGTAVQVSDSPGDLAFDAVFEGSDPSGTRVAYRTAEKVIPAQDTDNSIDIYEQVGGSAQRLITRSVGTGGNPEFAGYAAGSDRAFFTTAERVTPDDTDNSVDLFVRANGSATTKLSPGNGAASVAFGGISASGTRAAFSTAEALSPADGDAEDDVYLREGAGTALVSAEGIEPDTAITGGPGGPTRDAAPAFTFTSSEPGSTFECRVDGAPFAPCGATPRLPDAGHAFEVRAVDRAGNADPTPARRAFLVDTRGPALTISRKARRADRKGRLSVAVRCPAGETGSCTGTLTLRSSKRLRVKRGAKRRVVTLARTRFTIAPGRKANVKLKLSRKNRRLLARLGAVRVNASGAARDGLGNARTTTAKRIVLRAPKPKRRR